MKSLFLTKRKESNIKRKQIFYEMKKIDEKLDQIINHFEIPVSYKSPWAKTYSKLGIEPKNFRKNNKPDKKWQEAIQKWKKYKGD